MQVAFKLKIVQDEPNAKGTEMKLQKSFDEGKSPTENEVSNWDDQLLFWIGICSSKDLTQFTSTI